MEFGPNSVRMIREATCWDELFRLSRSTQPLLTVVDPYVGAEPSIERVKDYLVEFPHSTVVTYSEFDVERPEDVVALARLRSVDLIVAGVEDRPGEFAARLARAVGDTVTRRIGGLVDPLLPADLVSLITTISDGTALVGPQPAASWGGILNVHPDVLRKRLRRSRLPPLIKLCNWIRIFHMAHHMEHRRCTIELLALTYGYPSASAFRNQVRRYLGASLREIRARGAFDFTANCFKVGIEKDEWSLC